MSRDGANEAMLVEIWSDFVCPFSYIGEHKLRAGIALSGVPAQIVFRSYQLRPDLPPDTDVDFVAMMAERRGVSIDEARRMTAGATAQAAEIGLVLRYDRTRATNTRRAHELFHFARSQERGDVMAERIFTAYFVDGLLISDSDTLLSLAAEVGLNRNAAAKALANRRFAPEVDADITAALDLGVTSVPHIVIDGRVSISGGQSPETFAAGLRRAQTMRL